MTATVAMMALLRRKLRKPCPPSSTLREDLVVGAERQALEWHQQRAGIPRQVGDRSHRQQDHVQEREDGDDHEEDDAGPLAGP